MENYNKYGFESEKKTRRNKTKYVILWFFFVLCSSFHVLVSYLYFYYFQKHFCLFFLFSFTLSLFLIKHFTDDCVIRRCFFFFLLSTFAFSISDMNTCRCLSTKKNIDFIFSLVHIQGRQGHSKIQYMFYGVKEI